MTLLPPRGLGDSAGPDAASSLLVPSAVSGEMRRAGIELEHLALLVGSALDALQCSFATIASRVEEIKTRPHGVGIREADCAVLAKAAAEGRRALQFDDMAGQLIEQVRRRITSVTHAIESGDSSGVDPLPLHSVADRAVAVDFRRADESGSVDLF